MISYKWLRHIWTFVLCVQFTPLFPQAKWESMVYWSYLNVDLSGYDIVNQRVDFLKKKDTNASPVNMATFWVAGDSIVAYIYPNRQKSSFGGTRSLDKKRDRATFIDSAFLQNKTPVLQDQLINISVNNVVILENKILGEVLRQKHSLSGPLSVKKIGAQSVLFLQIHVRNSDTILITTKERISGRILDEIRLICIDRYPRIISASDLSQKEKVRKLLLDRDSLQLSDLSLPYEATKSIQLPPNYKDLLLLLRRFPSADSLRVEYRLIGENIESDTMWNSTESKIPIIEFLNLETGGRYRLQLRYNLSRSVIGEYKIHVGVYWWQLPWAQLTIAFLCGVVISATAWVFYKRKKQRELEYKEDKRKQYELQLLSVRSQLNPHFIFNSLSNLQSLVNRDEKEKANFYLGNFSKLIRATLENSTSVMITIAEEIEYLHQYLQIELFRFNFQYSITIDKQINAHEIEIPSMLLQPLAENAIKHGLSELPDGCLNISFEKYGGDLVIKVYDNGIGFDQALKAGNFGLTLTTQRVKLLSQMSPLRPVSFELNSVQQSHTECIFTFKNWL